LLPGYARLPRPQNPLAVSRVDKIRLPDSGGQKRIKEGGTIMPHVIVKLFPGRSEEQKMALADAIAKDVVAIAKCAEKSVSVAFEEIEEKDWSEKVYKPDILEKKENLVIEPGYEP
jgi:4-oxalocrotonate tautomerase